MDPLVLIPIVISFLITVLAMPGWIKKAWKIKLVWADMNKYGFPLNVAGSGGIIVVMGFVLSVLIYIAIKTFYFGTMDKVIEIFAMTTTILILAGIGIIDDLLGWQHGGLSKKFRLILCLFAAIPLMIINAGNSIISLPFLGEINLGLVYPLFLIPIGIMGAATTFNFMAGFNGLEAGQGIILLTAMSIVTYITGNSWLSLIGLCMVFALAGFWIYNKCPAEVFPGDVLTYPVGGLIAVMAILGNVEKIALFFFIPYIIEVILKSRGNLNKYSFGKPNADKSLELKYDKIYGMTHFSIWLLKKIKKRVYEQDVVNFIHIIQIIVILIGFWIFHLY
ncbi:glycosyl transferase family 4 [Candidatus Pacearchaeota archaeon]|nr:glycosyl transferase family 4 [Candidatus Pacearchaeota archaeon]